MAILGNAPSFLQTQRHQSSQNIRQLGQISHDSHCMLHAIHHSCQFAIGNNVRMVDRQSDKLAFDVKRPNLNNFLRQFQIDLLQKHLQISKNDPEINQQITFSQHSHHSSISRKNYTLHTLCPRNWFQHSQKIWSKRVSWCQTFLRYRTAFHQHRSWSSSHLRLHQNICRTRHKKKQKSTRTNLVFSYDELKQWNVIFITLYNIINRDQWTPFHENVSAKASRVLSSAPTTSVSSTYL